MSDYNTCKQVEFHLFWILNVGRQSCPELEFGLEQILLEFYMELNWTSSNYGLYKFYMFTLGYTVQFTLWASQKKTQFMQPTFQHWFKHFFLGGKLWKEGKKKNPPKPQD